MKRLIALLKIMLSKKRIPKPYRIKEILLHLKFFNFKKIIHYVIWGHKENRNPHPLFDENFYKKNNSDLPKETPGLIHYVIWGHKENRNPHPLIDINKLNKL